MRRRGARSAPFSLFAFQDVMASVIGMLFLIVLIMALGIVDHKAGGASRRIEDVGPEEIDVVTRRTAEQRRTVRELESEIASVSNQVELILTREDKDVLGEIRRLHARVRELYEAIESESVELSRLTRQEQSGRQVASEKAGSIEEMRRELAELKDRLKHAKAAPNLAYIMDAPVEGKEPWLLEVSEKALRVASKDGLSTVLEFSATSAEGRQKQFVQWARGQSSRTHYFVILIKPSGITQAKELEQELRRMGFQIGSDLLPEAWQPF